MKKTSFLYAIAISLAMAFLFSCSSPESRLTGRWITERVDAEIDSVKANLESVDRAIASTHTTKFVLNEDHTMALSIDGFTHDAFWTYNNKTDIISFRLDADKFGDPIELGIYQDDRIVYTSKVKHGSITAVYVKE
jgi:hypothetical protein